MSDESQQYLVFFVIVLINNWLKKKNLLNINNYYQHNFQIIQEKTANVVFFKVVLTKIQ